MDILVMAGLYVLAIISGTFVGILSGLIPGVHTNAVAALIVVVHLPVSSAIGISIGFIDPEVIEISLVCFLASVAMAHIFVSYIPATFLGAPEEGTALSVLPGHRLLLQGRGLLAVKLSSQGGLISVVVCLSCVLVLRVVMGDPVSLYEKTRPFIPFLLILVVLLMLMSEFRPLRADNNAVKREPATCLLVKELRFLGNDLSHNPLRSFAVWALWGLHGQYVEVKGHLLKEGDRIFLEDRARVELLFTNKDLRRALDAHINRPVYIKGRVCRSSPNNVRKDVSRLLWALVLFIISGSLGLVLLNSCGLPNHNLIPINYLGLPVWGWIFMPLFTGLFGLPTLLMSLSSRPAIPPQLSNVCESLPRKCKVRGLVTGILTGSIVGWFPGITSAEAALLASQAASDTKTGEDEEDGGKATEEFMVSVSAINTANAVSNFVALFVILKARSGAAKAAQSILGTGLVPWAQIWAVPSQLGLVLISILVSSIIAYFATIRIGKAFAKHFHKVPYRKLIAAVAVMLVGLVFLLSGPLGLIIMVIATLIGFIPPTVGVKRVHLMGCLILPLLVTWAMPLTGWGWTL